MKREIYGLRGKVDERDTLISSLNSEVLSLKKDREFIKKNEDEDLKTIKEQFKL
jgi:cell division protein FtsL